MQMGNSRKRKAVKCAEEKSGCLQAKSTMNITVLRWKALRVKKGRWEVAVSGTKLQRIFEFPSKDENNSWKRHDEERCYRLFFLPDGNLTTVQCRSQVITKVQLFSAQEKLIPASVLHTVSLGSLLFADWFDQNCKWKIACMRSHSFAHIWKRLKYIYCEQENGTKYKIF